LKVGHRKLATRKKKGRPCTKKTRGLAIAWVCCGEQVRRPSHRDEVGRNLKTSKTPKQLRHTHNQTNFQAVWT